MTALDIAATETTPRIVYDAATGTLHIEGESYPENVSEFYQPVFDWLRRLDGKGGRLTLVLAFNYLNTSSTKAVLDILQMLEDSWIAKRLSAEVVWRYRAQLDVMKETGEELAEDFELPFRLEEV
jgi:hypothetical protein